MRLQYINKQFFGDTPVENHCSRPYNRTLADRSSTRTNIGTYLLLPTGSLRTRYSNNLPFYSPLKALQLARPSITILLKS